MCECFDCYAMNVTTSVSTSTNSSVSTSTSTSTSTTLPSPSTTTDVQKLLTEREEEIKSLKQENAKLMFAVRYWHQECETRRTSNRNLRTTLSFVESELSSTRFALEELSSMCCALDSRKQTSVHEISDRYAKGQQRPLPFDLLVRDDVPYQHFV
jgi:chromosome segregation ATPase